MAFSSGSAYIGRALWTIPLVARPDSPKPPLLYREKERSVETNQYTVALDRVAGNQCAWCLSCVTNPMPEGMGLVPVTLAILR